MHERIRKFSLEGTRPEGANLGQLKETVRIHIENDMVSKGHIPNLDCGLHWTSEWNDETQEFSYKMTIYGIFVGSERANGKAVVYYDGKVHDC